MEFTLTYLALPLTTSEYYVYYVPVSIQVRNECIFMTVDSICSQNIVNFALQNKF